MRGSTFIFKGSRPVCFLAVAGTLVWLGSCSGPAGKTENVPAVKEPAAAGQEQAEAGMTVTELLELPKIDAHTHLYNLQAADEAPFMARLAKNNMGWFTICTQGLHWDKLQQHIETAARLHGKYPDRIDWATSFNLENWGRPDWQKEALATIQAGFEKGAAGVKVWKEIGMVLKDPDGSYVMIDNPRFDPLFDYIRSQNKTLVAHIGEPRNCWLPLDSMTVNNDRKYFAEFPQYHSYLHPEIPNYWKQIEARDHVLQKHPGLRVVGCHLGSLEFDVDELAKRFDSYPNFAVDMAARVCHFQVQDREKVRNFLIKYQDRVLYGTDLGIGSDYEKMGVDSTLALIETTYQKDYRYFATADEMSVWEVNGSFRGLALPAAVLRKIFHDNARKWLLGR